MSQQNVLPGKPKQCIEGSSLTRPVDKLTDSLVGALHVCILSVVCRCVQATSPAYLPSGAQYKPEM